MYESVSRREEKLIDDSRYRRFAVTVPLVRREDAVKVLFEVRSPDLGRQPGEICLPGGAREKNESAWENALRETCEELVIDRTKVVPIAQMDTLLTMYDNWVDVFLCEIKDYEGTFSRDEVTEIFEVPLDYFFNTQPQEYGFIFRTEPGPDFPFRDIPGGRNYRFRSARRPVYFYYYKRYVIWGMTAYIMRHTAEILRGVSDE